MSYTVTTTAGATIATIADGTVNTTATSLTLIGKNYAGYGIFLNENYIQLLENFSDSVAPSSPLTGQLWYDTVNDILKVYNADTNQWKPISSSISQATAPSGTTSVTGDIWWDTTNAQLKVWSGSAWVTIGPSYTSTSGTSGPVTESILDTPTGLPHVVTKFYISNSVIAILSRDAQFTPQTSIPGFTAIYPGFNLINQSTLAGAQFTGYTTGATTLGGVSASQFLRSDIPALTSSMFSAGGGLTVNSDLVFDASSSTVATISETTPNKNIRIDVNKSGITTAAMTISAGTVQTSFGGNVLPATTNTYNLGSSTYRWGTIYGTAVQSQYADLAERFESDNPMLPGTVVELGGLKEITAVVQDLSDKVFGVISTAAGFLMNGSAGDNSTHPPVAVNGRVPVRVVGAVKKGDRLVSAGNGFARSAKAGEYSAFNVIGRALADKNSTGEGTVEAIVKLNS